MIAAPLPCSFKKLVWFWASVPPRRWRQWCSSGQSGASTAPANLEGQGKDMWPRRAVQLIHNSHVPAGRERCSLCPLWASGHEDLGGRHHISLAEDPGSAARAGRNDAWEDQASGAKGWWTNSQPCSSPSRNTTLISKIPLCPKLGRVCFLLFAN